MLLADSSYPFLNAMWTMFVFFGWILFIWLLITVYMDLFRRSDINGWIKTLWVIFTLVLPLIGVFVYLLLGPHEYGWAQADFDARVRSAAGSGGGGNTAEQIAQAKHLLDTGAITQDEYTRLKQKMLVN